MFTGTWLHKSHSINSSVSTRQKSQSCGTQRNHQWPAS